MADESVGDRISHRFREASRCCCWEGLHGLGFQQIQGGQQIRILDLYAFGKRNVWLSGVVAEFSSRLAPRV
jgi:hypothetical protein